MPSGGPKKFRPWKFVRYKDKKGEWRCRIVSPNGNIIFATGDGYKNKRDVNRMIDRVRRGLYDSVVVEEEETK